MKCSGVSAAEKACLCLVRLGDSVARLRDALPFEILPDAFFATSSLRASHVCDRREA